MNIGKLKYFLDLFTFMDLYTLIFVQFGILLVSSFALNLIYKLDKVENIGVKFWRDGALISSIGALSLALFDYLPLAASVIPGISGIMIGYVFFWQGTKLIINEAENNIKSLWVISLIIVMLISSTITINDYDFGYALRVIAMSFVLVLFPFLSVNKILSSSHRITTGSLFLVVAFLGTGGVSLIRMILTIADLETKPKFIDLISFYAYVILYVVLVLGLIILIQEKLQKKLIRQATTDSLTKLNNRHFFYDIAPKVLAQAIRNKSYTSVTTFDLDYFKQINDTYGHDIGDLALKHFSEIAANEIRTGDTIARIGGEEFSILFPETNKDKALDISERIRLSLETHPLILSNNIQIQMTVSAGICSLKNVSDIEIFLKNADKALYEAKKMGRNCCILFVNSPNSLG